MTRTPATLAALLIILVTAACKPTATAGSNGRDKRNLSVAEAKALCWKADRLDMAFAGERVTVANKRLSNVWPLSFNDVVEWSEPPMTGRDYLCQRPSAVPLPVNSFQLHPAEPVEAADDTGRLMGVSFTDQIQAQARSDGVLPDNYRPTRLGIGRTLPAMVEPLRRARYLGTQKAAEYSQLYYFADARNVIVADCRTYPDAFSDADRQAKRTRLCEVIWHEDADPRPRTIKAIATVSIQPGREPTVLQAVVSGWSAAFVGVVVKSEVH